MDYGVRSARLLFFNDTATTEIYTLSLHDALPIFCRPPGVPRVRSSSFPQEALVVAHHQLALELAHRVQRDADHDQHRGPARSEEHTSELQSRQYLVCRLLLENKSRKRS